MRAIKYIIISLLIVSLCIGCNTKKSNNKDLIINENTIWEDAKVDAIYKQRIFINDLVSEESNSSFQDDIEFLESIKYENAFANKFLELLNESTIMDIVNNGSLIERYVLYNYLTIRLGRCEGTCSSNNILLYNGYPDSIIKPKYSKNVEVSGIKYMDRSFDDNYNLKSSWVPLLFSFNFNTVNDESTLRNYYVIANYFPNANSFGIPYVSEKIESLLYESHYNWVDILAEEKKKEAEYNWIEIDKYIVDKVINNNKEFLDFYINYKNNIFFERWNNEHPVDTTIPRTSQILE